MNLSHSKKFFFSFLAASILTAVMHCIHTKALQQIQKDQSLELSRQLAFQVEALALYAKEQNIPQAIPWAIQMLSVGQENKPIRMRALKDLELKKNLEKHSIDLQARLSRYVKMISPETNLAVEIDMHLDPEGFLGTHSKWARDLVTVVCFILIYSFFLLLTKLIKPTAASDSIEVIQAVQEWAEESHTGLVEFGLKTKEMIRAAKQLTLDPSKKDLEACIAEFNETTTELLQSMMQQAKKMTQLKTSMQTFRNSWLKNKDF